MFPNKENIPFSLKLRPLISFRAIVPPFSEKGPKRRQKKILPEWWLFPRRWFPHLVGHDRLWRQAPPEPAPWGSLALCPTHKWPPSRPQHSVHLLHSPRTVHCSQRANERALSIQKSTPHCRSLAENLRKNRKAPPFLYFFLMWSIEAAHWCATFGVCYR